MLPLRYVIYRLRFYSNLLIRSVSKRFQSCTMIYGEFKTWVAEPGGGCSPPVLAKFLQNLPFLPQILAFLCLQPPHVPVSPCTFKFTPPSMQKNRPDKSHRLRLQLHVAIYRLDSFVLILRYCANLKAIRYESTSLNKIVKMSRAGQIVILKY